jgi:hypothetical protein
VILGPLHQPLGCSLFTATDDAVYGEELWTIPISSAAVCRGDCAGDGGVTINDLILAVNVALGAAPVSACSAADRHGNGQVEINQLIAAVNAALTGCSSIAGSPSVVTQRRACGDT